MEELINVNNRRLISMLLAVFISAAQLCAAAATPEPEDDPGAQTVTSVDGKTTVITASPASAPDDTEDDDGEETGSGVRDSAEASAQTSLGSGITMEDPTLTPPDVSTSSAALLMDMNSGRVLFSKNLDERVFPASTTKIMTGIIALEQGNMNDVVSAPYEALKDITMDDSQMGILVGEELTMDQLIKGMLVYSANDAANVIAVHIAGSIDAFVSLMNQKARELGMTGTNFVNPCGSHDDNHYTTVRDLAVLSKYAMKNEQFREIVKMPIFNMDPTNKYSMARNLVNTNLFLSTSRSSYHYYPPATGIKTGHTSQSGYCLVSSAEYDGTALMAIVMGCQNVDTKEKAYSYIDSRALFDFGFDNYAQQTIASVGDIISDSKVNEAKDDMRVAVTVESDVLALIPNRSGSIDEIETAVNLPEQLNAPIAKGDVLGAVTYTYNGIQVGTANLIATNDVERNNLLHVFHLIMGVVLSPFFLIPALLLIIIMLVAKAQKKKRERKRRIQHIKQRTSQSNESGKRTPDRNASRTERVDKETKGSNSRYKK